MAARHAPRRNGSSLPAADMLSRSRARATWDPVAVNRRHTGEVDYEASTIRRKPTGHRAGGGGSLSNVTSWPPRKKCILNTLVLGLGSELGHALRSLDSNTTKR